jgi:hypothetical protein
VDLYGYLIPDGNKAIDQLHMLWRRSPRDQSATPAQPLRVPLFSDRLDYPAVMKRESGVSDGLRISSDPPVYPQDQQLTAADPRKSLQIERKSATTRNQDSDDTQEPVP